MLTQSSLFPLPSRSTCFLLLLFLITARIVDTAAQALEEIAVLQCLVAPTREQPAEHAHKRHEHKHDQRHAAALGHRSESRSTSWSSLGRPDVSYDSPHEAKDVDEEVQRHHHIVHEELPRLVEAIPESADVGVIGGFIRGTLAKSHEKINSKSGINKEQQHGHQDPNMQRFLTRVVKEFGDIVNRRNESGQIEEDCKHHTPRKGLSAKAVDPFHNAITPLRATSTTLVTGAAAAFAATVTHSPASATSLIHTL